jgi:hypothetical protein
LLAALLAACSTAGESLGVSPNKAVPELDALAPVWRLMQSVGSTVPQQAVPLLQYAAAAADFEQQTSAPVERLHCLAVLLVSAILEAPPVQAAAALLAAAGYMQGLRAASSSDATLAVLLHIAVSVRRACVAAQTAQQAAMGRPAHLVQAAALLRDAASLATLIASQVLHATFALLSEATRIWVKLASDAVGLCAVISQRPYLTPPAGTGRVW